MFSYNTIGHYPINVFVCIINYSYSKLIAKCIEIIQFLNILDMNKTNKHKRQE